MADPVDLVRRLCIRFPPRTPPPQRSRQPPPQPRCLVRARLRLQGSPLSLRCRALDASKPAAVQGEQCEEEEDDEEPYFSVTSSRLSEVDYLGESTKGDLNVRRRHLDALGGNGKSTLHGPIEDIAWKEAREAETLLSDLGIADPLTVRNSPRGIFCTRTLNLRSISVIGYDMDYTLIHYNVMKVRDTFVELILHAILKHIFRRRAYDYGMANLKGMGFPVDALEFDPDLVIRGLIMDKVKGNLVKADRFGYIKRVMHGT
ncbi:hypothetical protein ACQ4PT_013248 [Festuca glaucescens]